jgi:hypothetical protein
LSSPPSSNAGFISHPVNFFAAFSITTKTKLVHLNPNLILQIAVFVHLCETYLAVLLNFSL